MADTGVRPLRDAPPSLQVDTTVSCTPSPLTFAPGEQRSIDVMVSDVVAMSGYQVEMGFDPSVVKVIDTDPVRTGVNVIIGDFLTSP
ncbi:MAG: hypothetical protein V1772_07460, partial [Chloroflexota bacterium]